MPNLAWVEQKRRTGKVITDYLAAQTAGRYLKQAIESGYDNGREMYTMTVDEVLDARRRRRPRGGQHRRTCPRCPSSTRMCEPEKELQIALPGEPPIPGIGPRSRKHPVRTVLSAQLSAPMGNCPAI